jgi:hypothetical protein
MLTETLAGGLLASFKVFLLSACGYGSPYWLTYQQATERPGHVHRTSTAQGLSSGRLPSVKWKTRTEKLSRENLSCFGTILHGVECREMRHHNIVADDRFETSTLHTTPSAYNFSISGRE